LSYRYASGEGPSNDDPSELKSLAGSSLYLSLEEFRVGNDRCLSSLIEPKTITNDEMMRRTGSDLKSFGIVAEKADVISVKCTRGTGEFPPNTLILLLANKRATVLWNGVLLDIERPGNRFLPY
jgi:hypothetical protein